MSSHLDLKWAGITLREWRRIQCAWRLLIHQAHEAQQLHERAAEIEAVELRGST